MTTATVHRGWTPRPKRDNAHHAAKVEIRNHVLTNLEREAVVFDAFAGTGKMFESVWHAAAGYVGCDETWHRDDRRCFVCDNRRVLRCIDLKPFNVFDLDAYGSPWEQAIIIATRRPLDVGERLGLVLTDGTWSNYRAGLIPHALKFASGIHQVQALGKTTAQPGAAAKKAIAETRVRRFDELLSRALHRTVGSMRGKVLREWRATAQGGPLSGAYMRYIGVIVEGVKP